MIKNTTTCRFECHPETVFLLGRTGKLNYEFHTSRSDSNPRQLTARQYQRLERHQKTAPVSICSFRGKTWWWYRLEFFTAPENCDDHKVEEAIRARFHSSDNASPTNPVINEAFHARVLGLRGRVTFEDIRRHYRQRMVEYHPDKVAALGPKLRELAEEETKRINAAYEFFERKYSTRNNA